MSAALAILPLIWATADDYELPAPTENPQPPTDNLASGVAFYRKYTEALLRRYVKLAMECGRAPSLLGRELFRGNVTHYKVQCFDDVVIFVHDIERRLARLGDTQQKVIDRVALQEYTLGEAAELMRLPRRSLIRLYDRALDELTEMFLDRKLLVPLKH
jgi:hypothetical protein